MAVVSPCDSDVDRALQAFGGASLPYRSFTPVAPHARPADAPMREIAGLEPLSAAPGSSAAERDDAFTHAVTDSRQLRFEAQPALGGALEMAFVLELAPASAPSSVMPPTWPPPATAGAHARPAAPLAGLFRTLGEPLHATVPGTDSDRPDA